MPLALSFSCGSAVGWDMSRQGVLCSGTVRLGRLKALGLPRGVFLWGRGRQLEQLKPPSEHSLGQNWSCLVEILQRGKGPTRGSLVTDEPIQQKMKEKLSAIGLCGSGCLNPSTEYHEDASRGQASCALRSTAQAQGGSASSRSSEFLRETLLKQVPHRNSSMTVMAESGSGWGSDAGLSGCYSGKGGHLSGG